MKKYPVFAPPVDLARKPPRDWSPLEADKYFNWFLENFEPRVNNLLVFLGLDDHEVPSILLSKAQEELERLLMAKQPAVSLSTERGLTNQGYALAADLGLLVARLLIHRGQGKVTWCVLKKPKTDQSFNLPVLKGFVNIHLDPIAGSIGDAAWIARGNKKPDAWAKMFNFWEQKIG